MNQRGAQTLAHARGVAKTIPRPHRLLRVSLGLVYLGCGDGEVGRVASRLDPGDIRTQ